MTGDGLEPVCALHYVGIEIAECCIYSMCDQHFKF